MKWGDAPFQTSLQLYIYSYFTVGKHLLFDIMKANGGITYMSIQSDIEMLSIEALEYYAKKHQISEDDAFNIFYKHQVFEKYWYNTKRCTN